MPRTKVRFEFNVKSLLDFGMVVVQNCFKKIQLICRDNFLLNPFKT